jgi:hypothetical protein
MKLLDLKNLFTKNKTLKEVRRSSNRSVAEDQMKIAIERRKAIHQFGGVRDRDLRAIYIPNHGKFKGYMRENRKCSFNTNR